MNKDLVRVLLSDSEGIRFSDQLIEDLIEIFTPSELILSCMLLTDMTINFEKIEKFIMCLKKHT